MSKTLEFDLCVIGAGWAGIPVASAAAQLGVKTVLIEKEHIGGDTLNYAAVPSKALVTASRNIHELDQAYKFGGKLTKKSVDFEQVKQHIHEVKQAIIPLHSQERLEGFGVHIIKAAAKFISKDQVEAGEYIIGAKRFVIAAGGMPVVPPINGIETIPYYTYKTILDIPKLPKHLLVIGGGASGIEYAQSFRRLGAEVSIIEMFSIMPKDDPELVDVVRAQLREEGIKVYEKTKIVKISQKHDNIILYIDGTVPQTITGSDVLICSGRLAQTKALNLGAAGIEASAREIFVNSVLRTTNKHVYALGDIAGGRQLSHRAQYHASVFIKSVLFAIPFVSQKRFFPWVTFSDPELAHIGLNEEEARAAYKKIQVLRWRYEENDRAQMERKTDGMIKVIIKPNGRILGVSLVGYNAGELIIPWVLAIERNINIRHMAKLNIPYPCMSEIHQQVASNYYIPLLLNNKTKAWVTTVIQKLWGSGRNLEDSADK